MPDLKKAKWRNPAFWFLPSLLVLAIDQWSKYYAVHHLYLEQPYPLLPFFNLTLRYNMGAAFNLLSHWGGWQVVFLSTISILVIIIVSISLMRLAYPNRWVATGLSLLLGGAAGNLVDRLRFAYVIDFFDFHIYNWHYAIFNVADSAIVVGVFVLMVHMLFKK